MPPSRTIIPTQMTGTKAAISSALVPSRSIPEVSIHLPPQRPGTILAPLQIIRLSLSRCKPRTDSLWDNVDGIFALWIACESSTCACIHQSNGPGSSDTNTLWVGKPYGLAVFSLDEIRVTGIDFQPRSRQDCMYYSTVQIDPRDINNLGRTIWIKSS